MCRNQPIADHDPKVCAYLQRPLRTYEEALRDVQRTKLYQDRRGKIPNPIQCADPNCDAVLMTKGNSNTDPEREIALLNDLPYSDLVACWLSKHSTPPPKGMSRKLLLLAIAYRIQADAYGDLDAKTDRYLRGFVSGSPDTLSQQLPATPLLKPGMRLMREWNGRTHVVDVTETGLLWNGETYPSLSAITGARWSGPRFFGLLGKTS